MSSTETYNTEFEKSLKRLPQWIKTPIRRRAVVYAGDFENNAGEIEIVNYRNFRI